MRRIILILSLILILFSSCKRSELDSDRLIITATSFPAYDAARAIFKDKADIKMILPIGSDLHGYEPTSEDIIRINNSDLFIYVGGESEDYIKRILQALDKDVDSFSLLENASFLLYESDDNIIELHDEDEEESLHDEHVWTSLENEIAIIDALSKKASLLDSENAEFYISNAKAYISEIRELQKELKSVISLANNDTLVVADRFPLIYFTHEFDLDYIAAFPGCAHEGEASARVVASLIDYVKENNVQAIIHMEGANTLLSQTISSETGCKILQFNSCHNVTLNEFRSGVTYVDLMKANIDVIKEALR